VDPFRREYAAALPDLCVRAAAVLEAAARYHPELLDAMCFPSGLDAAAATAATAGSNPADAGKADAGAGSAGGALVPAGSSAKEGGGKAAAKKGPPPFSALDGLWALLQNAHALLQTSPRVACALMGVLSTLWECQGSAHGAVELLRSQVGFWDALKVRVWWLYGGLLGGRVMDCGD